VNKWTRDGFGLKGGHAQTFFPLIVAEETDAGVDSGQAHPVWASVRLAAATGECPSLLDVEVKNGGLIGTNVRILFAKKEKLPLAVVDEAVVAPAGLAPAALRADRTSGANAIDYEHCALVALAYLAVQPEVNVYSTLYLMTFHSPHSSFAPLFKSMHLCICAFLDLSLERRMMSWLLVVTCIRFVSSISRFVVSRRPTRLNASTWITQTTRYEVRSVDFTELADTHFVNL